MAPDKVMSSGTSPAKVIPICLLMAGAAIADLIWLGHSDRIGSLLGLMIGPLLGVMFASSVLARRPAKRITPRPLVWHAAMSWIFFVGLLLALPWLIEVQVGRSTIFPAVVVGTIGAACMVAVVTQLWPESVSKAAR